MVTNSQVLETPNYFMTGNVLLVETGRLDSSLTNFISNTALIGGGGEGRKEICDG
jgi:hypothetical protein